MEETSLSVGLLPGFRTEDSYALVMEGKPDTIKHITYFLAEYHHQAFTPPGNGDFRHPPDDL